MSVINQMLNGLEQRGVQVAAGQVRPVHVLPVKRKLKAVLSVLLLAALALLAFVRHGATVPPVVTPVAEVVAEPVPAKSPTRNLEAAVHVKAPDKKMIHAGKDSQNRHASSRHLEKKHVAEVHKVKPVLNASPVAVLPVKQVSAVQQADAEFHKAGALMQQGRNAEAQSGFEAALRLDAGHVAARRSLVALLLEGNRGTEAEQILHEGLKVRPANTGFAMLLARLQIQRNDLDQAIVTLEASLPHAVQQAEYQAFYAALLQRKGRHGESVEHYQLALKTSPDSGVWLMGCGISLQALARSVEARDAYQRALASGTLSPELQAFVQQKIKAL